MKTNFLGPFLFWLKGGGSPVERWLDERGLDHSIVGARECHVPHAVYCELLAAADAATRESALGLTFAGSANRTYTFMEAIWQNCPDVDAIFQTWAFYDKAMAGRMTFTLSESKDTVGIEQTCEAYDLALERISNEFLMGWFVAQIRVLTGIHIVPREVAFAHPAPRDRAPYADFFGTTNVHFAAGENRLTFDACAGRLPVPLADARVYEALTRHLDSGETPEGPPNTLRERLHQTIEIEMAQGMPQLEGVAKRLGVSVRTLQRRIAEEDSSFAREVERVRESAARRFMREGELAFGEIAVRLGYADSSTFHRAFKRWTGLTPTEFRAYADTNETPAKP